ncbi:hypothetical protein [uncultured Reyranella sp.]|jgi:hypothetical protein|uniref:hypothetical protein n=1 Tax=uncultured Reyranella sp. TaxID=735512 RepID=UPI00259CD4A3|nr:hypothetical protein [uncultured Reyranella sp.]
MFQSGELWRFNNKAIHEALKRLNQWLVHLIFCASPGCAAIGKICKAIFAWLVTIVSRRQDLTQFMAGAQIRFAEENAQLALLRDSGTPLNYDTNLAALTDKWAKRAAAPILMLGSVADVLAAITKGASAQLLNLQQIRRQVDATIRKMVPARISRCYDLKLKLPDEFKGTVFFGKTGKIEGLPRPHPAGLPSTLVLRATGVVDLMEPERATAEARGYMPGFALNMLPGFDVATFMNPPSSFAAGPGKPKALQLRPQGYSVRRLVHRDVRFC